MTQCAVYTETKALSTHCNISFVVIDTCNHPVLTMRTIMQYLETQAQIILQGKMQHLYLLCAEVCLHATQVEVCHISQANHSSLPKETLCTFSFKHRVGRAQIISNKRTARAQILNIAQSRISVELRRWKAYLCVRKINNLQFLKST